jgi:hypothetical protein
LLSETANLDLLRVEMLRGHAEVIEKALLLEALALRCNQAGAMHWLEHFLAVPTFRGKTPYLVLGVDAAEMLAWAVLMYELTPLGLATGVFSTDDISGFRSVIAPASDRAAVAGLAADALLERGAQIVMISRLKTNVETAKLHAKVSAHWAVLDRAVVNTLTAGDTYEATLMSLGKGTRFNMRYYRRRLMQQVSYELVEDARGLFTVSEFDALNAASLNPMPQDLMRLQYASACNARGGFLTGMRSLDGRWLGVVGGWRQADTTVLLWQMNRAGFERASIGTVMRGHFLENEIAQGARRIVFYGGTPNSIRNAFKRDTVEDLVVVRRSRKAAWLMKIASLVARPGSWRKSTNFLAATLHDDALEWHETGAARNE